MKFEEKQWEYNNNNINIDNIDLNLIISNINDTGLTADEYNVGTIKTINTPLEYVVMSDSENIKFYFGISKLPYFTVHQFDNSIYAFYTENNKSYIISPLQN